MTRRKIPIYFVLGIALVLNSVLWTYTYRMQPYWPNVPPPPTAKAATFLGLGDSQLAYRGLAYQLQLMGNRSGLSTPLYRYDYNRLGEWFFALNGLDQQSNYVPYLASYYFGATQDPKRQLGPVIDYLHMVGKMPIEGKWRWLAQAVEMAYHKKQDHDLAMRMAYELAALPGEKPHWAQQMPAIIAAATGDRHDAVRMMKSILASTINDPLHPADPIEVNFMIDFICRRTLTRDEAAIDPVCTLPNIGAPLSVTK